MQWETKNMKTMNFAIMLATLVLFVTSCGLVTGHIWGENLREKMSTDYLNQYTGKKKCHKHIHTRTENLEGLTKKFLGCKMRFLLSNFGCQNKKNCRGEIDFVFLCSLRLLFCGFFWRFVYLFLAPGQPEWETETVRNQGCHHLILKKALLHY